MPGTLRLSVRVRHGRLNKSYKADWNSYFKIMLWVPCVIGSSPIYPVFHQGSSSSGRAGKNKKLTVTGILFLFYFEK